MYLYKALPANTLLSDLNYFSGKEERLLIPERKTSCSSSPASYQQPSYNPHNFKRLRGIIFNRSMQREELINNKSVVAWRTHEKFFDIRTDTAFNGVAPSADGKEIVLYHDGYGVGRVEKNKLYHGNSRLPFTGFSSSFNGKLIVYYSYGQVSFVADPHANCSPFTGENSGLGVEERVVYIKGVKVAEIIDGKMLDLNGNPFNGNLPNYDGKTRVVYQHGEAIGHISGTSLVSLSGLPFSGRAPSYDGKFFVLCERGYVIGKFIKNRLLDNNGCLFSGVAPTENGDAFTFYLQGEPAELVSDSEELFAAQQQSDTTPFSFLKKAFARPKFFKEARRSCVLDNDGNLSITFRIGAKSALQWEIFYDPLVQKKMFNRGIWITVGKNKDVVITVTKYTLNIALTEVNTTSQTNTPFVKIIERVIDNLYDVYSRATVKCELLKPRLLQRKQKEGELELPANRLNRYLKKLTPTLGLGTSPV